MAVSIICDICKKEIADYDVETRLKNQIIIGNTYRDQIGPIDTCRDCRKRIEDFIFKMKDENKEDVVVDPDKKCCYNCKYAEIDNYNNSRCNNPESMSYNVHMLAEKFYCKKFERKEENKDDNAES